MKIQSHDIMHFLKAAAAASAEKEEERGEED
jgi:hypothetical protein